MSEETYGEDPWLTALNGVAMVKGLQGRKLSDHDAVVSDPKHFAVHGIPEAGSNISPVNIGEREARSSFLSVFEKSVKEGGAMAMMGAYSEIDGIPCVDNHWLLTTILRKEWGFKGFVLADLGAIKMTLEKHQTSSSVTDALSQTLKAGMNMQFYDFPHEVFRKSIHEALGQKILPESEINRAVSDILRVKFMLGLFDHPYIDTSRIAKVFHSEEHVALSLKAAQEGICLLKNEHDVLPIRKETKRIALIGALAKSSYLGGYANKQDSGISIFDGLKKRTAGSIQIDYEPGYTLTEDEPQSELVRKAVVASKNAEIVIVVLGENTSKVGEGKDRANLDLDENQMALIKAVKAAGTPVAVVLFNGRPLTINWVAANIPAIVESWFSGEMGGIAVADVILGNVNPSGKLPMTFPRSTGQIPFYYNHKPTSAHIYVDEANTPLFPFGFGLSYTKFEYSNLRVPATMKESETVTVTVSVKNTGKTEGTEVVQMYIRDLMASVTTPVRSLKGFGRVSLKPGEEKQISFPVGFEQLALWNREMKQVVEPGDFNIAVGSSSADIRVEGKLTVTK